MGSGNDARREMKSALNDFVTSYPGAKPVSPLPVPGGAVPNEAAPGGKQELLAAFDKLVEHEATKPRFIAAPAEAVWRRFVQPAIIVTSAVAMLYLWVGRPSWLYPTFEPMDMPVDEGRIAQLLTATSIIVENSRVASGRLPGDLAELGIPLPAMSITTQVDGSFELSASTPKRHYLMAVPVTGGPQTMRGLAR